MSWKSVVFQNHSSHAEIPVQVILSLKQSTLKSGQLNFLNSDVFYYKNAIKVIPDHFKLLFSFVSMDKLFKSIFSLIKQLLKNQQFYSGKLKKFKKLRMYKLCHIFFKRYCNHKTIIRKSYKSMLQQVHLKPNKFHRSGRLKTV